MSTKKEQLTVEIALPQGVQIELAGTLLKVKGPKGEIERDFISKVVKIEKADNKILLKSDITSKNGKKMIYSFAAHVKNMINGILNSYVYKLKICSGHFPISVKVEKERVAISNFLGEKVSRISKIMGATTKVNLQGDLITVEGPDVEKVSQTAANLETATKISNRDRRRFQDGIYMIEKAGVKV